jgi:pyridoxine 5-phosphate synthase
MKLGVNIDHIATLREARKINEPDPVVAVQILKEAGADQVTIHWREDERHIHRRDVELILALSFLPVNLECGLNSPMLGELLQLRPHRITLVPERREEVTTEGGLNVVGQFESVKGWVEEIKRADIEVSLFIEPDREQILAAKEVGADFIELHTGKYANLHLALTTNLNRTHHRLFEKFSKIELKEMLREELKLIEDGAILGFSLGLGVGAGHGLNYQNVRPIVAIPEVEELNIGHSIVAQSVFVGLKEAIKMMKEVINAVDRKKRN